VMSRMLGLSVGGEPGSAADFELVTRLEKLILANQTSVSSTLPVDHAFSDHALSDHAFSDHASTFRRRRTDAPSTNHRPDDVDDDDDDDVPDSSRSYEGQRTRSRSRSLSPMRSRDPNVY